MKKIFLLLSLFVVAFHLSACGKVEVVQDTAEKLLKEDRAGNFIDVPVEVHTIVSLAPSVTQILCDLGVGEKIIAADTNSPMYAAGLPEDIILFNMLEPDLEQIIASQPDIIFVSNMSSQGGEDIFRLVKEAGICVAEIPTAVLIEDVERDVLFIAECVGRYQEGLRRTEDMQKVIAQVKAVGDTITEPKNVYFEISPLPYLYSFGTGVYLNEMLELIGARNILEEQEGWMAVNAESVVTANPDVILTNNNFSGEKPEEEIISRTGWESIAAIKERQVFYIDNTSSSLPNHHIVDALVEMAKAIYPEEFSDLEFSKHE